MVPVVDMNFIRDTEPHLLNGNSLDGCRRDAEFVPFGKHAREPQRACGYGFLHAPHRRPRQLPFKMIFIG